MRPNHPHGLPLAALTGAALAAALLLVAGPSLAQLPADAPDAPAVTEAPWSAWLATTPDDGFVLGPTDIEFASTDQPVILYRADNQNNQKEIHLKERTLLGWTTDRIPDAPARDGSLALGDQDEPHVAYERSHVTTTDRDLIYAHRAAGDGSWTLTQVHDASADGINIALNDTGHPRISYERNDTDVYFAYKTSSGWVREQVDSKGGFDTDLALDSDGDPHIAYTAGSDIWYANKTGGSWVTELAQEDCGIRVSLALDSQDRPHIACHLTSSGLGHIWKNTTGWHNEVVDKGDGLVINHPGGKVGMTPSIVLDGRDRPHIGYRYIPNFGNPRLVPGQPHYATQVDGDWVTEVVDRDGQHSGLGMDIALDDEDRPHLTYVRDNRFEDGGGFPGSGALQSLFDLRYARPVAAETLGQAGR